MTDLTNPIHAEGALDYMSEVLAANGWAETRAYPYFRALGRGPLVVLLRVDPMAQRVIARMDDGLSFEWSLELRLDEGHQGADETLAQMIIAAADQLYAALTADRH